MKSFKYKQSQIYNLIWKRMKEIVNVVLVITLAVDSFQTQ